MAWRDYFPVNTGFIWYKNPYNVVDYFIFNRYNISCNRKYRRNGCEIIPMKKRFFVMLLGGLFLILSLLGCQEDDITQELDDIQNEVSSMNGEEIEPTASSQSEVAEQSQSVAEQQSSEAQSSEAQVAPSQAESQADASQPPANSQVEESSQPTQSSEPTSQSEAESQASEPQQQTQNGSPPAYLGVGAPSVARGGEYLGSVEQQVLDGINAERAALGLSAVSWDDNLGDAARIRSSELFANSYLAHDRPNGNSWNTVLKNDVPVNYSGAGEILAAIETQGNAHKISDSGYWVGQWVGSSTHYAAMTNPEYTHAGVGIVYDYDEDTGLYYGYATTLFAYW